MATPSVVGFAEGGVNLLASRKITDGPSLGVINNSVIVASEDGSVWMLDRRGYMVGQGRLNGRSAHIQQLKATPRVALATDKGEVKTFVLER